MPPNLLEVCDAEPAILSILQYLTPRDILRLTATCRKIRSLFRLGWFAGARPAVIDLENAPHEYLPAFAKLLTPSSVNDNIVFACYRGYHWILKAIRESGVSVESVRVDNNWCLRAVCEFGHAEALAELHEWGLTAEDARSFDSSGLRLACSFGHIDVVKRLRRMGLTAEDVVANDAKFLRETCDNCHIDVMEELWSWGLPRRVVHDVLSRAVVAGNKEVVATLKSWLQERRE